MMPLRIILLIIAGVLLLAVVAKLVGGVREVREEVEAKAVLDMVKSKLLDMRGAYSSYAELNFSLPETVAGHSYTLEIVQLGSNRTLLNLTLDSGKSYTARVDMGVIF